MDTSASFTGAIISPNFIGKLNDVTYTVAATAPTAPVANDIWIDTASKLIKCYNGTAWITIGGGSSPVTSVAGRTGDVVLASSDVGLGNVTNESKATMFANSALTGVPTAPTAGGDTSTTQIATTAFVLGQAASTAPPMDGTAAVGTSRKFARADHVHPSDTSRAPVSNPTFTGTVTAPNFVGDLNGSSWIVASSAPSSPTTNDMWVDTANLLLKRWNGSAWDTIISQTGGGSGGVTVVAALGTASSANRGSMSLLKGAQGAAEVVSLTVASGCTANGSVTLTLDEADYAIPLTTASNTAALVASVIRGFTYFGWTAGGSGTTVTFTSAYQGARTDPVYSAGTTGAAGTVTTTKQGITSTPDELYISAKLGGGDGYGWIRIQ